MTIFPHRYRPHSVNPGPEIYIRSIFEYFQIDEEEDEDSDDEGKFMLEDVS